MIKIKKLEKWSVVSAFRSSFSAPETETYHLRGINETGDCVVTSSIIGYRDNCILTKSGSAYKLGKTDPDYEKLYPNARKRLFKRLEKL